MSYEVEHLESSLTDELLSTFDPDIFVESGTNLGAAVGVALRCGFKKVYSIEKEVTLYNKAVNRFGSDERVKLICGDSRKELPKLIKKINKPAVFWLDGHIFGDVPLIDELTMILNRGVSGDVILIDDIRMLDTHYWNVTKDEVLELVKNKNISYANSVNALNDIMIIE